MSFSFRVELSAETKRRIQARQDERGGPLTEDELRAVLAEAETSNEDELYAAYCAAFGIELVDVPPDEWERIQAGIAKGVLVDREIAAQREEKARELAEHERREQAEADRLWPAYQAALGPCGGYA